MDENKAKESGVTPLVITRLNGNELAPRGCLVRVTCGTDRYASRERWFAVGIYFQKLAEAAVCSLPQIEPTDVVFARRPLKPAEIETLGLRRGQVVPCSVNDVEITFGIAVRDDTGATVESRSDESMLGRQRCGLINGRPSAREDVEAGRTCPDCIPVRSSDNYSGIAALKMSVMLDAALFADRKMVETGLL